MTVHQPVVAGSFYPANAGTLRQTVADLIAKAPSVQVPAPKALILPHAGYRFSGAVAAAGAVTLREGVRRVVILGPSHRHAFRGVALPNAQAMATPIGEVPLDAETVGILMRSPDVAWVPKAVRPARATTER